MKHVFFFQGQILTLHKLLSFFSKIKQRVKLKLIMIFSVLEENRQGGRVILLNLSSSTEPFLPAGLFSRVFLTSIFFFLASKRDDLKRPCALSQTYEEG